jgi:uncharacterized protein (TIGR03437 family)
MKHFTLTGTLALAMILAVPAVPQEAPTVIQVDVENLVNYGEDVTDLSKIAKGSGIQPTAPPLNFAKYVSFADIVAVNGSPAKGTLVMSSQTLRLSSSTVPGMGVADITRGNYIHWYFEFQTVDGAPIGSIFCMGLAGGAVPPGSPPTASAGNNAITGGTGAFFGVRGGTVNLTGSNSGRAASQAEDPSMRRINGGGKASFLLQILPMSRPEIAVTAAGLAVFHYDWSPVTSNSPARIGETLIVYAKGLGPTMPGVNPGDPFPTDPIAVVTSPVEVLVDGKAARAINQLGVPGTVDTYRVDFLVPGTAATGMVPIQLRAAWVKGTPVQIPVR